MAILIIGLVGGAVPLWSLRQPSLQARLHPNSPVSCGVEVVEIGIPGENGQFNTQLAFLRDKFDDTYPGIIPKVRTIWDYSLPYKEHYKKDDFNNSRDSSWEVVPGPPPAIIEYEKIKKEILLWTFWDFLSSVFDKVPVVGPLFYLTADQFVDAYRNKKEYARTKSLYKLRLLLETENKSLLGMIPPSEIERIMAVGSEYSLKGLLISEGFEELVYHYQLNARRANRSQAFGTLLGAVNREGLVAKPILRDFVVVYYDPSVPQARELDDLFLDIKDMRRIKDASGRELIPLGIYGIGQARTRVTAMDLTDDTRIKKRKIYKHLMDLGANTGAIFVPFPFTILLKAAKEGVSFVLSKTGKNMLSDMLQTEAELAALIDSGLAALDPGFVEMVRGQLDDQNVNIFRAREREAQANQSKNMQMMGQYLVERADHLCKEVDGKREKDFRKQYLDISEKVTRFLHTILAGVSKQVEEELVQQRTDLIRERQTWVNARQILKVYDESTGFIPHQSAADALVVMAMYSNEKDVEMIARFVRHSSNLEIEWAAMKAVGLHGAGELAEPVLDYLDGYDPYPGLIRDDEIIRTAWESFLKLRLSENIWEWSLINRAKELLAKYEAQALDEEKVFLMMIRGQLEGLNKPAWSGNNNNHDDRNDH